MAITVILPNALRPYAAGNDRVALEAQSAGEALDKLIEAYPQIEPHLPDDPGQGKAIYRNGSLIHLLQGLETPLRDGDTMTIIVASGEL